MKLFVVWMRTVPPISFKAKPKKTSQGTNIILSSSTVKMASWENGDIKSSLAGHIATPQHIFFVLPLGSIGNFSACCSLPLCVYVCVLQTPEWLDSDSCQKCDQPFFWNFKQMWDSKKIGLRQVCMCPSVCTMANTVPLGFSFIMDSSNLFPLKLWEFAFCSSTRCSGVGQ